MKKLLKSLTLLTLLSTSTAFAAPLGFILMRVYVPAGGDISKVPLPSLTFEYTDGSVKSIQPCTNPQGNSLEYLNLLIEKQPNCGWSIAVGADRIIDPNIALPDTAATYWATPFIPDATVKKIVIKGTFPNTRYFSFNSYDATGSSFEVNGAKSSIPDFKITPDSGYQNPWQQPALAGGKYTVHVVRNPSEAPNNALLMPSAKEGGPLSILANIPNIKNCNPTCFNANFFRPAKELGGGVFPNSDSAYLLSMVKPSLNSVMVIRGKLPTFTSGDTPTAWPSGKQVRYASFCNNLLVKPYPVVNNGCLKDSDLKLDNNGYYTIVVSHIKPVLHNHNWLPYSILLPLQQHALLLRNMISNDGFTQSALNVPEDNQWTSAQKAMGEYYPTIKQCSRLDYALNASNCKAIN